MEIALSRYILIKMHIQLLLDFVNVYGIRPGGQNKGELPVHHPGSLQLSGDNIPIVPLHYAVCSRRFGGEDHKGKEKLEDVVSEHRVLSQTYVCFTKNFSCFLFPFTFVEYIY